jgi:hypothetical protein
VTLRPVPCQAIGKHWVCVMAHVSSYRLPQLRLEYSVSTVSIVHQIYRIVMKMKMVSGKMGGRSVVESDCIEFVDTVNIAV